MIIPVYKPLGASTHQLAAKVGAKYNEKATHTGTLDPMAEGIVVVLTGADRFSKEKYALWRKTYRFEVLFGITTDSLDLLGLPTQIKPPQIESSELQKKLSLALPQFIGEYAQTLPDFSAKRLGGESYFDKAKRGELLPSTTELVTLFSLDFLSVRSASFIEVQREIKQKINLVTGDFRQSEIHRAWQDAFGLLQASSGPQLYIASFEAVTSKRTYIRALVRDLSNSIGIPATTYSISRTRNGPYSLENCATFANLK